MPDKIFYFDTCMCEESNAVDGGIWLYSSKILGNSNLDFHLWKRDVYRTLRTLLRALLNAIMLIWINIEIV